MTSSKAFDDTSSDHHRHGAPSRRRVDEARNEKADKAWRPTVNPWIIAVCVTLAAFMEILDTTIVNVALPYIAGSLGVSSDKANYVITSYLVANGVVLTISGWLSDTIGRKRYFIICIAMFTICSFLCGISQSLAQIVVFRLLQGLFGGGLQPNQQAIILDTFEPAKRGTAFAVTAIATIVAPVLGPTLGGYITITYDWRWIFYVNIPVGIFAFIVNFFVVQDPPWEARKQKKRKKSIDFLGLGLITLGLGCLQIMMDRGEDDGWFGSSFIVVMGLLGFLGLFGAVAWLLTAKKPIVNLEVFKDNNFAVGCVLIGALGGVLYSSGVVIPQFAQQVLGYDAYSAGLILSPGGILVILLIPFVGLIMKRVQVRFIVIFGFLLMSLALFYSSRLAPDIDFRTLVLMRASQSAALAFLYVPISQIAYLTLPRRLQPDGAALFSMFRNVLGAFSVSGATAAITERTQADQAHLVHFMTPLHPGYNTYISAAEAALRSLGRAPAMLHQEAVSHIFLEFKHQAAVLAYTNVFFYESILAFLIVPFCFFISSKKPSGGGSVH